MMPSLTARRNKFPFHIRILVEIFEKFGGLTEVLMLNEFETQSIFMAHKLKSPSCTSSSALFFFLTGEGRGKTERDRTRYSLPSWTRVAKCQPIN